MIQVDGDRRRGREEREEREERRERREKLLSVELKLQVSEQR